MPKVVSERNLRIPEKDWVTRGLGIIEELAKGGEFHTRVNFNGDIIELTLQKYEWSEEEKTAIAAEKEAAAKSVDDSTPGDEEDSSPSESATPEEKPEASPLTKLRSIPKFKRKGK